MLYDTIKALRESAWYSQAELAKKLDVTRISVNSWEMGVSTPTTYYIIALSKLFHVSADYILGIENERSVNIDGYSKEQLDILYSLIRYFDSQNDK